MKPKNSLPRNLLNRIQQKLLKKQAELDADQKLLIEEDPYLNKDRELESESLDAVQEDISKTETDLRLSTIKQLSIQVKKALAKINVGTYGICDVCEKPISDQRLKAFPEATTCVEHSE